MVTICQENGLDSNFLDANFFCVYFGLWRDHYFFLYGKFMHRRMINRNKILFFKNWNILLLGIYTQRTRNFYSYFLNFFEFLSSSLCCCLEKTLDNCLKIVVNPLLKSTLDVPPPTLTLEIWIFFWELIWVFKDFFFKAYILNNFLIMEK